MVRVYTYEEVAQYFDQDTYGDLLDLLRDMINGQYTIDSVRLDINEYTENIDCYEDGCDLEGHVKI